MLLDFTSRLQVQILPFAPNSLVRRPTTRPGSGVGVANPIIDKRELPIYFRHGRKAGRIEALTEPSNYHADNILPHLFGK